MLCMFRTTLVLIALCVMGVMAAVKPEHEKGRTTVVPLEGTWSSGSQRVITGMDFFNPFELQFKVPRTSGISYSFHSPGEDKNKGFYETAQYFYSANATNPRCFKANLVWHHGTFHVASNNGSIIMKPFASDGRTQLMTTCNDKGESHFDAKMHPFSEPVIIMSKWFNYVDTKPGFVDNKTHSQYAMQLYQSNGKPVPLMFQVRNPPEMLPTRQIFMQVL